MAKKINMSAVREFMFHHGEKVALGTCVFVALIFGVLGLMRAMSAGHADGSSDTYANEFKKHRDRIRREVDGAAPPEYSKEIIDRLDDKYYEMGPFRSFHIQSPYNNFPGQDELKRVNPPALAILKYIEPDREKKPADKEEPNTIMMQYMSGLVWVHEIQGSSLKGLEVAGAANGPGPLPMGIAIPPMPMMGKKPPMPGMIAPGNVQGTLEHPVLKAAVPVRMVVVSAVFPMKQQMEEFQRALKMLNQGEMYYDDLPKPLGMNVQRFEVVDGKAVKGSEKLILSYDPTSKKSTKNQALDDLLRVAIYDDQVPELLEDYLWEGLVTPMPKFANNHYPKFEVQGIEIAEDDGSKPDVAKLGPMPPMPPKGGPPPMLPGGDKKMKGMPEVPNMAGAGAVERTVKLMKKELVEKADPALYARLFARDHDYNVFHALGLYPPKEENKAVGPMGGMVAGQNVQGRYFSAWDIKPPAAAVDGVDGPMGPMGPMGVRPGAPPPAPGGVRPMNPMGPMGAGGVAGGNRGPWERDALVRFIDNDVEPGKTYQYAVMIHLANPNFNKKADVAFAGLAEVRTLASKWEYTPTITIPRESYLYAVDQHLLSELAEGKAPKKKDGKPDPFLLKKDETTFQLHQWVGKTRESNNLDPRFVGDWAIAERVVVKRGEEIGKQATVNLPIWYKEKDSFEVPKEIKERDPKKPKEFILKQGMKMDFNLDDQRPILVDFTGGKHGAGLTLEDSAVEALILSADGKLSVLNSRIDSDPAHPAARGKDRHERVMNARQRVDEVNSGVSAGAEWRSPMNPMNPMMPKLPGARPMQ